MKKVLLGSLFLVACGKMEERVSYMTQQPTAPAQIVTAQPVPTIIVNVGGSTTNIGGSTVNVDNSNSNTATGGSNSNNNTATGGTGGSGGSVSNSGNSTNNNSANGGSSSATGGSSSSSSSSSSSNDNTNNNSNEVQPEVGASENNVDTKDDIDVDNENEVLEGLASGRVRNSKNGKCKKKETKKHNKEGHCLCVAPAKKAGLNCNLYDLTSLKPNKLPDFSTMTPVYKFVIDKFDITDRDWSGGFPKIADTVTREKYLEWYGIRCSGTLAVKSAETYTFYLTSDDGANMYLNGTKLIDNDGLHSTAAKQNSVSLNQGNHDIMVDYYQGPRTRISLVLEMSSSSIMRQVVDSSLFSR